MFLRINRKQKNKSHSRKELRKEKRQQKKKNRFNYHNVKKANRKVAKNLDKAQELIPCSDYSDEEILSEDENMMIEEDNDKLHTFLKREKKEHEEYYREMKLNRVEQLKKANEEEDKVIAKYEKLLKLNRRKKSGESSTIGKFNDGLDYLLELCTDDNIQKMYEAAKEAYSDTGDNVVKKRAKRKMNNLESDSSDEIENLRLKSEKIKKAEEKYFGDDDEAFFNAQNNQVDNDDSCDGNDSELESESELEKSEPETDENEELQEDIYGRKRDKHGNVLEEVKYIPPHMRNMVNKKKNN